MGYIIPIRDKVIHFEQIDEIVVQKFLPRAVEKQNYRILVTCNNGRSHEGLIPRKELADVEEFLFRIRFQSTESLGNENTIYHSPITAEQDAAPQIRPR